MHVQKRLPFVDTHKNKLNHRDTSGNLNAYCQLPDEEKNVIREAMFSGLRAEMGWI